MWEIPISVRFISKELIPEDPDSNVILFCSCQNERVEPQKEVCEVSILIKT